LDFNQIEHLVEVHKIDEIYLMAACQQQRKKPCFRLGFKYEFFILNLAKAKKIKKKYSGHRVLCFGPTTPKKIRLNTPSWSRPRYTESASNLVKDGVNTTIISLV
jgi:hypothetical protein